jgi:hypothetical protein
MNDTSTTNGITVSQKDASKNLVAQVQPGYVFLFGVIALLAGVTISLVNPNPPPFPLIVTTVLIGLGGAAIASGITGFLEVESRWVRAGGPLGVLVFLCFFISQSI